MPLYEYRCATCGELTEVIQRHADPPLTVCPLCGGPLKKLLSAPSFQFKGSGWYVTDYARAGGEKPATKTGGGEGAADSGKASSESAARSDGAAKSDGASQGGGSSQTDGASAPSGKPPTAPAKPAKPD